MELSLRAAWAGVLGILVALTAAAVVMVAGLEGGPVPPFLTLRPAASPTLPPQTTDRGLRVAGSGSNLPVTRALAAGYAEAGGRRVVVHPSIGSGGGLRALLDDAIDVALVSRGLRPSEGAQGLVATPYAEVAVAVAVHPSVPPRSLSGHELVEIFAGRRTHWSDGSPIVVLQRERGDSSHQAVQDRLPGFEAVNEQAYRENRWRVLYHDDAMLHAIEVTEGAIGLHGSGREPGRVHYVTLPVDGVLPTVEAVESGAYPYTKVLSFVTRGPPQGEAAAFIAFTRSEAGRSIIRGHGGVPRQEEP